MSTLMRRRAFIVALGTATLAWPRFVRAQQALPVIGVLVGVSQAEWAVRMAGFRSGLSEWGYVEGRNVAIEGRFADGRFERLPGMAADLVGRKVAAIFAGGSVVAIQAAITATQTIPVVFATNTDPIATGLVASFSRPGGNATGVTLFGGELAPKRLELLRELLPTATRIALLVNPNNPVTSVNDTRSVQAAALRLGLEIVVVSGGTRSEIETAFATAVEQRVAALFLSTDAFFSNQRAQIAALGLRHALPTVSATREGVDAGELMSYGATQADGYRQAGVYVGRILKGEKPADLPVMQPTRFELVVNLKTAKALGLTIPEAFLLRADEVIE